MDNDCISFESLGFPAEDSGVGCDALSGVDDGGQQLLCLSPTFGRLFMLDIDHVFYFASELDIVPSEISSYSEIDYSRQALHSPSGMLVC